MTETDDALLDASIEAALKLAGDRGWRSLTLAKVAETTGRPLGDYYGMGGVEAIADGVEAYFDKTMSAEAADPSETPRERLFDAIMRRFEAMESYRAGLVSLMRYRERSPARLAALIAARRRSARWALACADLDTTEGPPPALRTASVAWAIGRAERSWRRETSADFSRTMATLDRELRDADERLRRFGGLTGRRKSDDAPNTTSDLNAAVEDAPEAPQGATPQG